jgi:hypothetical protein
MTIALDPCYVHGGFEAQSTGKVAFNRVLRFGLLQRGASMSPTNATHGMAKPLHQPPPRIPLDIAPILPTFPLSTRASQEHLASGFAKFIRR